MFVILLSVSAKPKMKLEWQEADLPNDFPALARLLFDAYEEPNQRFLHAWFPIVGEGNEAREAAIREAGERLQSWHEADPSSRWHKIVDTDSGKIAGSALWNISDSDPFEEERDLPVTWFPDDGSRKFVEQAIKLLDAPRIRMCPRPHVFLFIISVHPSYRRKGIAQQFMDWGIKTADENNWEFWLDATPVGKPLYDKNGFVTVYENIIIPKTDNPDEAWKKMESRIGPFTFWSMWRPAGGYVEGKTVKPWE